MPALAFPNTFSPKTRRLLPWVLAGGSALLVVVGMVLHDPIFHRGLSFVSTGEGSAAVVSDAADSATTAATRAVTLSESKYKAAAIVCEPAKVESLPSEVSVSGRIEADSDRSVQVQPRAPGVVREVKVVLGQSVKQGDLLARIDSAEVATARLNLRARQRELDTVRIEARWKHEVSRNVRALIPELRNNTEASLIDKKYANRPLGSFRALLLQAYADFDIASHEEVKTKELFTKEIVRDHQKFLAVHNRESAQAKLESIIEQADFDATQQGLVADQDVKLAEGAVVDAAQKLKILGVREDIKRLLADPSIPEGAEVRSDDGLTTFDVVAPFDGTIVSKSAVPGQKAELADILFAITDLSTVWVRVDIPESEFRLIPQFRQGKIRLAAAAYPGKVFDAKLLSIGATVDPTTRTIPILAETANPDELLKIGLFIKIALEAATHENVLTIDGSSVVDDEGTSAVFVQEEKTARTYALRTVQLGRAAGERRIVLSGLKAGEQVVSQGTFLLKSELLLANDVDED